MTNKINKMNKQELHYTTTDSGNADRLIEDYGHDFCYCEPLGGWLHWNGVRWLVDRAAIWACARAVGKGIAHDAADTDNRSDADMVWRHGKYSLSESGIRKMILLAEMDARVRVGAELFDMDPYLLNVSNGTIDIRNIHTDTGELRKQLRNHDRHDLITKLAPVTYDSDAEAVMWDSFVERVLPDEEVRKYVQKAIGQALTGATEEQAFYLNQGVGDNGKNTLFDTIITLLGDYAEIMDIDVLMEGRGGGGASPELAKLRGKRFVVASESDEGHRLKPGLIKRMTGDKYITARALYKDTIKFERQFKLFMHVNHKPEISDTGYALWKRVRLIPWTVRIPAQEKDKRLPYKLGQELSGVLNWALAGYRLYDKEGLEPPPEIIQATTQAYRYDQDKVGQFIAEKCTTEETANLYVTKDSLYNAYSVWCGNNNIYPLQTRKFGEKMFEKQFAEKVMKIAGKATKVWLGIGLLTP
jgi:putative DNA primase/helicase